MFKFKRKNKTKSNGTRGGASPTLDNDKIPKHIGIIMDGNGRWANRRALPRNAGHRAGAEQLRKITDYCETLGVEAITAYAFSTENWNRPQAEVDALMKLLLEYLKDSERRLAGKNRIVRVIGDRTKLTDEINAEIDRTEKLTQNNTGISLNLAINYGGRDEIVHATRSLAEAAKAGMLEPNNITIEKFGEKLYTAEFPEVELIIRTGGERRLSNFLLWQCCYAEFWYTDTFFPDFGEREMKQALLDFQNRERRFGKV